MRNLMRRRIRGVSLSRVLNAVWAVVYVLVVWVCYGAVVAMSLVVRADVGGLARSALTLLRACDAGAALVWSRLRLD